MRGFRSSGSSGGSPPSGSPLSFPNRSTAGRQLGPYLAELSELRPVVLGIAGGGLEVGLAVAHHLGAELDVLVARRLTLPGLPELTVGAVVSDGLAYVNPNWTAMLPHQFSAEAIGEGWRSAYTQEKEIRGPHLRLRLNQRVVILVDDAIATGSTMMAALAAVRRRKPARVVVAAPVGDRDTCKMLVQRLGEEVVCPHRESHFRSVAAYYPDGPPVHARELGRRLALARLS